MLGSSLKKIDNNDCLISVVIPCFNGSESITRTIESIPYENYNRLEIIVVDDCSTDDSVEVLSKFEHITVVSNPINQGVSYSRNYGVSFARGKYVLFLDADDVFLAGLFPSLFSLIEKGEYSLIIFSYRKLLLPSNKLIDMKLGFNGLFDSKDVLELFFNKQIKPHLCTFCIRREIALNQEFNKAVTHGEDLIYQIQVLMSIKSAFLMDDVYFQYTISGNSAINKPYNSKRFLGFELIKQLLDESKVCNTEKLTASKNRYITMSFITVLYKVLLHGTADDVLVLKINNYKYILRSLFGKRLYNSSIYIVTINMAFKFYLLILKLRRKLNED